MLLWLFYVIGYVICIIGIVGKCVRGMFRMFEKGEKKFTFYVMFVFRYEICVGLF